MHDFPSFTSDWKLKNHSVLNVNRDISFELMLVAIEENSGHWINLTNVEWGQEVQIQVDTNRPVNSRLQLKHYKTWCTHNGG